MFIDDHVVGRRKFKETTIHLLFSIFRHMLWKDEIELIHHWSQSGIVVYFDFLDSDDHEFSFELKEVISDGNDCVLTLYKYDIGGERSYLYTMFVTKDSDLFDKAEELILNTLPHVI